MNLCCRESLCDIRRDGCHHFVSERDLGRDAQRVCQAGRSLMSPSSGRDETSFVRLCTTLLLTFVNFIVNVTWRRINDIYVFFGRIYAEINRLRQRKAKQRHSILRRFSSKRNSSFRRKRSMRKKREIQQRKEVNSQVVKSLYFVIKEGTLFIILFCDLLF